MENPHNLKVSHNWGDIIPYSVSTIIRIYGFKGTPHVLPYQVPLKVGVAKFLWQLGGVEEKFLHKSGTRSNFSHLHGSPPVCNNQGRVGLPLQIS